MPTLIFGATSYSLADAIVDIADSGEMAVYRATYVFNYTDPATKKPVTEYGNEVTGFKRQSDGGWKIAWSVYVRHPGAARQAIAGRAAVRMR